MDSGGSTVRVAALGIGGSAIGRQANLLSPAASGWSVARRGPPTCVGDTLLPAFAARKAANSSRFNLPSPSVSANWNIDRACVDGTAGASDDCPCGCSHGGGILACGTRGGGTIVACGTRDGDTIVAGSDAGLASSVGFTFVRPRRARQDSRAGDLAAGDFGAGTIVPGCREGVRSAPGATSAVGLTSAAGVTSSVGCTFDRALRARQDSAGGDFAGGAMVAGLGAAGDVGAAGVCFAFVRTRRSRQDSAAGALVASYCCARGVSGGGVAVSRIFLLLRRTMKHAINPRITNVTASATMRTMLKVVGANPAAAS